MISLFQRLTSVVLAGIVAIPPLTFSLPRTYAEAPDEVPRQAPDSLPFTRPNPRMNVPVPTPPSAFAEFSAQVSDAEIRAARVFEEGLVPHPA